MPTSQPARRRVHGQRPRSATAIVGLLLVAGAAVVPASAALAVPSYVYVETGRQVAAPGAVFADRVSVTAYDEDDEVEPGTPVEFLIRPTGAAEFEDGETFERAITGADGRALAPAIVAGDTERNFFVYAFLPSTDYVDMGELLIRDRSPETSSQRPSVVSRQGTDDGVLMVVRPPDAGPAIDHYRGVAVSSADGSVIEAIANGTDLLFPGLRLLDDYVYTVFAVRADGSESASEPIKQAFTNDPPVITGTPGAARVGEPYAASFEADAAVSEWALHTILPIGLSFDPRTAAISGTPSQSGTFEVVITAWNHGGVDRLATTIEVAGPAATPTPTPSASATAMPTASATAASVPTTTPRPGELAASGGSGSAGGALVATAMLVAGAAILLLRKRRHGVR